MEAEQTEISQLVTSVFRAWRQAGVDFLVLRNYERLPEFTSNDIDVLVAPSQLRQAEQTLLAAAGEAGFRLHNRAEFATLALYLSSRISLTQTHFDLFTALKWRGFDFLDCRQFLARKQDRGLFAVPRPAHEAATNLLAALIFTGKVKEKYQNAIAAGFQAEPKAAEEVLAATYGRRLGAFLVGAGAGQDWEIIEALTGLLRRTLIWRQAFLQPGRTIASLVRDARRLVRRWFQPPGISVVLCGADGSGKSSAAVAMIERLSGTFSRAKGRHFHWKPPLWSAQRQARRTPTTDPHSRPPRNPALSALFFGAHWFEFLLGWPLRVRPITFRGGLALIDRFYYDFFVDQRRYRLRLSQSLVRLGYRLLPHPDLVLLLDAPPEVLQSRKHEVPLAETERQRAAFRELVQGLDNGRTIDAAQPLEAVTNQIARTLLDFMAERTAKRWGTPP